MKASWQRFYRRIGSVLCAAGATAWSSALCHAQIAADNAGNAAYADGWQAGDNGGTGFLPWNFDNDTIFHVEGVYDVDASSPFNQLGTAWRLGLNYLDEGQDIVRAGRGLAAPLAIGQSVSIVVDNPVEQRNFGGYFIRLNAGGANICYANSSCTPGKTPLGRFGLTVFNNFDPPNSGRWAATGIGFTPLFAQDLETHDEFPEGAAGTNQGMRMDFTLTDDETFDLTMTPLDEPAKAFTATGNLDNPGGGSIDWIEFTHFMKPSNPDFDTDFYIRSLAITGPSAPTGDFDSDSDSDGADFMRWQRGAGTTVGGVRSTGDANSDGAVNGADLVVWEQQFGPAAAAAVVAGDADCGCGANRLAINAAVPEPTSFAMAAVVVAALAGLRPGRHNGQ